MDSFSYGFDKKGSSRIGAGFILFCLFVAFMLAAIPLPNWMESWRPCWVALLVFYFVVNYPQKYGVFLSFVTGIFLDVFNGGTLGEQALGLSMIAMVATTYSKRFKIYPRLQQSFFVFLLFLVYVIFLSKIQNFDVSILAGFSPIGEALSSAFLWTWVAFFLDEMTRRFNLR